MSHSGNFCTDAFSRETNQFVQQSGRQIGPKIEKCASYHGWHASLRTAPHAADAHAGVHPNFVAAARLP
jgi:ribulose kinase